MRESFPEEPAAASGRKRHAGSDKRGLRQREKNFAGGSLVASHKLGMLGKRIGKGIAPKSSAKHDRFTPECLAFGSLRHAVNVGRVAFFLTRECSALGGQQMWHRLEKMFSYLVSNGLHKHDNGDEFGVLDWFGAQAVHLMKAHF